MLKSTEDYIKINKNGIFVVNISGPIKEFMDWSGMPRVTHSLDSFDYLKID